ncbi:Zn(II)2Cys6 transcription factor [Aspergillus nomiae NRRL 13137]|uniref:Zn(II)2Cys6 transcription factor n=1 Tax=Aspergillus nomiae NRRL (strain ATCC 15546 / NRRL 13137 / CBS 260.88 / M93) TaxID=1509407 RepID=A0A0L1IMW6_ASPN3|nr:Zn(II)2Cys6 transcription factor [Aspergillus nomiae NRRL 13137]KNG80645.1 Zn(II)2Cys6 transcription factor [Aspergillus nomiae NRRL 13137]
MRKRSITPTDSQRSSRSSSVSHSTSVSHSSPELPLILPLVADSTWEERAVCHFFDQFTCVSDEALNHLGFLPSLYATCRDSRPDDPVSSCLKLATEAAALITLSNHMKAPPLLLKARGYYGLALHGLRRLLGTRSQAVKDETFATMVILSIFEDIAGERNGLYSSHTKGFGLLMAMRGESQLSHAQGRDLFICAYAHTLIESIVLRTRPRHGSTSTELIVGQLDGSEPVPRLIQTATKIGQLFAESSSHQGSLDIDNITQLTTWIETGNSLALEMANWSQHLPDHWLPLIVSTATGGSLMTYQNASIAAIWTYYRAARISLQRHLLDLRRNLASLVGDNQASDVHCHAALEEIQEMTSDTCRSIPFSLGDVDAFGQSIPTSTEGRPPIRALYGYLMLWPLWYVLTFGMCTVAQMEQIRSALGSVGSVLGIKLAFILAQQGSMSQHATALTPNPYRFLPSTG